MEKFVLGLNPKTRRMLEAFNSTYEEALWTPKSLEEPLEKKKTEADGCRREETPCRGRNHRIPTTASETSISE